MYTEKKNDIILDPVRSKEVFDSITRERSEMTSSS